jgi:hypothetical protein
MVGLYMDENVRGAITEGLRQRGVDVLTVQEDGRAGAADQDVLDRATELGRVLVSEDRDLVREATQRQRIGTWFAGVFYSHQTLAIGQCVEDLEIAALVLGLEECACTVRYLPLR